MALSIIEAVINGLELMWAVGSVPDSMGHKLKLPFLKMNGAGNDFVVLDVRRVYPLPSLTTEQIRRIANRKNRVTKGCDQVIVIEPSSKHDVFMRIYNADGGEVASCGNASRCVGWLLLQESGGDAVTIATKAGNLRAERAGERVVTVDMGAPRFAHKEIPIAADENIDHVSLEYGALNDGVAVGMGNPHIVFFVADAEAVDLGKLGPLVEMRTDVFPERVNVSVAQVVDRDHITLRVWERGAGLTLACGTAACATLVAAHKRGLAGRAADIAMPGGSLRVEWREDNHVWMTGPVEEEFRGEVAI